MPQGKQKKRVFPAKTTEPNPSQPTPPEEGLPAPKSVIGKKTFVSPKGRRYLILKTTESDPADKRKRKK